MDAFNQIVIYELPQMPLLKARLTLIELYESLTGIKRHVGDGVNPLSVFEVDTQMRSLHHKATAKLMTDYLAKGIGTFYPGLTILDWMALDEHTAAQLIEAAEIHLEGQRAPKRAAKS